MIRSTAAIARERGAPLSLETIEVRPPGPDEVLIELKAAGLCHTDLHIIDGHMQARFPIVLGHEGAGVVLECGRDVTGFVPGDHVIPFAMPDCGQCFYCQSGRTNLCTELFNDLAGSNPKFFGPEGSLFHLGGLGTFTRYTVVREINLAKVRSDAPFDVISYIGCGVATGLGAALITARVEKGSTVIVFGLGGVGLNVVQGAHLAGAEMIVGVDTNLARAGIADTFGMTHFVDPASVPADLPGHLIELTRGGADFAFECVGNTKLMRQALESTRMGWGVCVLVGEAPHGAEIALPPKLLQRGRRLIGTAMGGAKVREDIPRFVDWYMEKKIRVDELISHRLPFEQINDGFEYIRHGKTIRSVVVF